ncbi:hypothetical protein [Phenylobacterium sp.]|uniref:hypothetical protein n=1 Tax=Phenylobacterium sp. TaxID=1871053 RepID=UPI00289A5ADE|nr:hypothetical protein [Phenylobacterium sp.]
MSGQVLVTGASGKTGKSLVGLLKDRGVPCRAATRGGEPAFDWTAPETWAAALEDVASVYLVAPPTVDDPYSKMIEFLKVATREGSRRFVFLGMASLPAGGPAHGQVHQWLKDNSDDWAVLAPSAFMQNFAEGSHLATIRDEDRFYSNTGDGRVPFISADDIARAAFALLTGRATGEFVITGGEAISYDQVAERIREACGRAISHARISTEELVARFLKRGLPELTARFLAAGYETIAAGAHAQTTDVYSVLTGARPTTFEAFAEANAQVWRRAG